MADLKDPRFQQGFKFAGSAASAAGGLVNRHILGGGQSGNTSDTTASSEAPAGHPPKASKPSGLGVGILFK